MSVISNGQSFCVLPWLHSFVNSNGNYQVCCTAEEYHQGIPDSQGNFFNIKNQPDLDSVMNSNFMKLVRTQMMNGKWPLTCSRCRITEQNNGVSRRIIENQKFEKFTDAIIQTTKVDGSIVLNFKSIDYRLGNLCNLECRMCGPHSSTRWLKDWNDVKPKSEQISNEQRVILENYDWIEKNFLIDEFHSKLSGVEALHFAGGEPLIIPQMIDMLQVCVSLGFSKNIELSYNTNLTTLPPRVLELWKEFKKVSLLVSIDGFDKVNEYIRFPSKWSVLDSNLKYLDENFETLKIEEILLSCTVQIYNVLNLNQLYDYLKNFKNIVPALNLINLNFPQYMQTTVLPPEVKKIATIRLEEISKQLLGTLPAHKHYLIENIIQIINIMNKEDSSIRLKEFIEINSKIDNKKRIQFENYVPELANLLESYI